MPPRRSIPWLVLPLLCALAGPPASAMDPTLALAQLHRTRWTTREGAPADVNALAQTPDGALWLATSTGLVRFDGVRFDRYQPRPGEASLAQDLSALLALPSGELVVGARLGGVHVLRDGHLTSFDTRDGLPSNTVLGFAKGPDGRLWAGTTNGLYVLEGAHWSRVGSERGLVARYVSGLLVDARGSLWVTGPDGSFELPPGAATFARRLEGEGVFGGLARGPDGTPWLSSNQQGFRPLAAGAPAVDAQALGLKPAQVGFFLVDRDQGLWIALDEGVARLPDARRALAPGAARLAGEVERTPADAASAHVHVETMLEDREGDLWLGSADGLERLRRNRLRPVPAALGTWPSAALAVDPAGTVHASNLAGDRLDLGPQPIVHRHRPGDARVAAFAIGADGTAWRGGVGEITRGEGAAATRLATPLPETVVQTLAVDGSGTPWVSIVRDGVYRVQDGAWRAHGGVAGLPDGPAMCLAFAGDGRLWAGYTGDRVALVHDGKARLFGAADGLRVGAVLAISARGDGAWVGGTGGLALLLHGRFWSVQRADGSDIAGVSGIVAAANGELWLNGAAGVTRIAADELARFLADPSRRVAAETFDHEDGLDGLAAQLRPLPSAAEARDGRLWFATSRNLWSIDPRNIARNPVAPGVRILALKTADGDRAPAPGLALPVGSASFALDYTAFSLAIPERVRFRYRLEGVDAGWQDAGGRRQAYYTNVGPGHYRFRVVAANEDGVWNETGDSLEFTIPPAFWQTGWFATLCALAALVLLWSLWTLRLRQLAARMASQRDARLQERERIARELHDTLLQSTQGLILNFQGLALQLPAESAMRGKMEAMLDRADVILADARSRVLDLRSAGLTGEALPEAIAQAAAELGADETVQFRAVVEGTARELQPAIEVECYRIAREALANAFAHAQASAIEVQVLYGPLALRVRIRDDGRGLAPEVLAAGERPGHWGLVGMRERARRFGARVELWSRAGAGTEVELTVPAAVAYRRLPRGRWWPWRRRAT